jgi:hypothetical protein
MSGKTFVPKKQEGNNKTVIPLCHILGQLNLALIGHLARRRDPTGLFGGLCHRHNIYEHFAARFFPKRNLPFDKRKQSMVFAHTNIIAGAHFCATLAHDDVTGKN